MVSPMNRVALGLIAVLILHSGSAPTLAQPDSNVAAKPAETITAPPPASGRSLSRPESITAADVMARLRLTHANLELIREFMGLPEPPAPLFEVSDVSVPEGYFATLNLKRRALRLAFEQLRVEQKWEGDLPTTPGEADAFNVTNEILVTTLQVKAALGITTPVAEKAEPDSTTMSDVFNQVLTTGALLNAVLSNQTKPEGIFFLITVATHQAMGVHRKYTNKLMPDEPAFEANKTPDDVLKELEVSYGLVRELGKSLGLKVLVYRRVKSDRSATSDDVSELGILIVAGLERITMAAGLEPIRKEFGLFGRRFAAHVFQRSRLLTAILTEAHSAQKTSK